MPVPAITTPAKSLVTKLAKIMGEVGTIPKNGTNLHFNYKFVREADLVEKLSILLAQNSIFITSSTKGIESIQLSKPTKAGIVEQKMGILRVEYTFHDGESGETLTVESVGEIDQDGGKGLYKALTGAMKYFLMKSFLVATGDDPEQVATANASKAAPARAPAASTRIPAKQPPMPPSPIEDESSPAFAIDITEIGRLCKETHTDHAKLFAHFKVDHAIPTKLQAKKMLVSLRDKLEKQIDEAAKANS